VRSSTDWPMLEGPAGIAVMPHCHTRVGLLCNYSLPGRPNLQPRTDAGPLPRPGRAARQCRLEVLFLGVWSRHIARMASRFKLNSYEVGGARNLGSGRRLSQVIGRIS
jgi:hypothetical protein